MSHHKREPGTSIASASGRLDVMGGISDYSGALVLQMPISERVEVRFKPGTDYLCDVRSTLPGGEEVRVSMDYRTLLLQGKVDYRHARNVLHAKAETSWLAYVLGCVLVLQKERGVQFTGGTFDISSRISAGKGVSSSAALEVAVLRAIAAAFQITFEGTEAAVLAQRAEHEIAGAPCGLMDQLAVCFGQRGALLPILCQPDILYPVIPVPGDILFAGMDSGIRHAVGGASYGDVRCAAFMGYTIIAHRVGATEQDIRNGLSTGVSDLPFGGYLCNIPLQEFEQHYLDYLPDTIQGADFIERYGVTADSITQVNPDVRYAVRACSTHPVREMERTTQFAGHLRKLGQEEYAQSRTDLLLKMGALMNASHQSYSACGLGSERTDEIAAKALTLPGIYGARITGGGSGGTVCILAAGEEGRNAVHALHAWCCDHYSERLTLFV